MTKRGAVLLLCGLAGCTTANPSYRSGVDALVDLATPGHATALLDAGAPADATVAGHDASVILVGAGADAASVSPADLTSSVPDLRAPHDLAVPATGAAFGQCTPAFGLGTCDAICDYFGQTCVAKGCQGATLALYDTSSTCATAPTTSAIACSTDFVATLPAVTALGSTARCCCK